MRKILLFVLLTTLCFCQNDSQNYKTEEFQKGLPNEIKFKWESTLFAPIEGGNYFKKIYIISRDSLKTEDKVIVAPISLDGGFYFSKINFTQITEKEYQSSIELRTSDEDYLSKLIIRIDLEHKQLKYRWDNIDSTKYKYPSIIKEYELKVGKTFPIIRVKTNEGVWSNEDSKSIVLINWWATSCIPCVEEMPGLNELVEKYKNESIEFLSIVWDVDNLSDFLSKHEFNYLQGYGTKDLTAILGETFPRNIIINSDGKILYNSLGGSKDTYLELDKIISKYL